MKCINKFITITLLLCLSLSVLSGCSKDKEKDPGNMWMPFSEYTASERITSGRSSIIEHSSNDTRFPGFSADLCVFDSDISSPYFANTRATAALLINMDTNEVLYANNAFEKRYPASITKLMTAYTAQKYLNSDSTVTCTHEVTSTISDPTAVMLGVQEGDYMTFDQALRLTLLSSYNDVAVAIGAQAGGDVDSFASLMNEEAHKLGCTGTHFVNPSGLHEDNHYTTAYDLYLIFKEVLNTPYLLEIIQGNEYSTTIHRGNGAEWNVGSKNTNQYFKGNYNPPSNIFVVGGKTGTTEEAGRCLMIMVRDTDSTPYIAVVLGAETLQDLYESMTDMLNLCQINVAN